MQVVYIEIYEQTLPYFKKSLNRIPFLWARVHFRFTHHGTLQHVSSLTDGVMVMSAFTFFLFTQKFSSSSCKSLVCWKIFPFCWNESLGYLLNNFSISLPLNLQYYFSYYWRWLFSWFHLSYIWISLSYILV